MDFSSFLNKKYLVAAAVLVVSVFLVSNQGVLSFGDSFNGVEFDDCQTNNNADITGCSLGNAHFEENIGNIQANFGPGNSVTWIEIRDIEPTGDSHSPQTYWLFKNGYISDSVDNEDRNDFSQLHLNYGDFTWNDEIKNSLEQASTCKPSFDIASHGEFYVKTSEEAQQYNDEPDFDERHGQYFMTREVALPSSEIRFEDGRMYCKVNLSEYINRGMELSGEFENWDGRTPVLDEVGASGSVSVSFSADSDGDDVLEVNDNCPEQGAGEFGLTQGGCPVERQDLPDSDGDGVKDRFDSAPNTYGSSNDGSPTFLENFVRSIPGFDGWKQDSSFVSGVRVGSWF